MSARWLALVNPAAGGGRGGKLAPAALARLRAAGIELEVAGTRAPGQATELARNAYAQGRRHFLAVGGDGTAFEVVNGLFPAAQRERPTLAFLPLGTGNSFLRDFSERGTEHAFEALVTGRARPCDVLRVTHREGVLHCINLFSLGLAAEAAALRERRFKALCRLGYVLAVFGCLARLRYPVFPLRVDGAEAVDRRPCLFLSFSNSKFTGGRMLIAPQADPADGLIEFVRWGPIGRLGLLANFHRLFDGTHVAHPRAWRQAVRRVEFALERPVTAMVDGEVLAAEWQSIEVLPAALNVMV